ncbi:MAG: hypothetical protein J6Z12_03710 [Paludibacteraceae bacterium]|nr:hypothetical protein [Paludibacteraceae bacterium]
MKKNIRYSILACLSGMALVLGAASCDKKDAPALAIGSKWLLTEEIEYAYFDGVEQEDLRDTTKLERNDPQYLYVMSENEISLLDGTYGEYGTYFYDEKCKVLKFTYEYQGQKYPELYDVLVWNDNTIQLRQRTFYDDDYMYQNPESEELFDYGVMEKFTVQTYTKQ